MVHKIRFPFKASHALFLLIYVLFVNQAKGDFTQLFDDSNNSSSQQFIPVEQAFRVNAEISDGYLNVTFDIEPGHYLYKKRFKFTSARSSTLLGQPTFPKGVEKYDINFDETLEVFPESITVKLLIESTKATSEVDVQFQGCAEAGLCYPPHTIKITVINPDTKTVDTTKLQPIKTDEPNQNSLTILFFFLIAGIGLTFTPCVLPMIPILSSILVGASNKESSKPRIFSLTTTYVLSMSLTFAVAGTLMGLFGASLNLQAKLQSPWILIPFALLFVVLSLSMFGVYELQLPARLRDRLNKSTGKSGSLTGAFLMGILSALVVSPCVSAPLAGALIYISTTGDALFGGLSLFALGLGMGLPLLALGVGGKHLLPKTGLWMDKVKTFFGFMLLGVAIWMLERVIPGQWILLLWGSLAIGASAYLGALDFSKKSGWSVFSQAVGIIFLTYGICLIVGAAKGNSNPLQPLSAVNTGSDDQPKRIKLLNKINTLSELSQQLDLAQSAEKPALIDVYADWCLSCKVMERTVFPDPTIQQITKNWHLIKFDITENTPEHQKWLNQYQLFGPPSLLFFDASGQELPELRSLGEISVPELREKLSSVEAP